MQDKGKEYVEIKITAENELTFPYNGETKKYRSAVSMKDVNSTEKHDTIESDRNN